MAILHELTVLRRLQTNAGCVFSVIVIQSSTRRSDTLAAWSRALPIIGHVRIELKRHMPGEFHDCSWMFWSRHCSRKGARRVEERRKKERRKKKTKMTKLDFHRLQVRHFSNNFEQSPCYCKMGQRQRADLSV